MFVRRFLSIVGGLVIVYLFVSLVWCLLGVMTHQFQKAALFHLLFSAALTSAWQMRNAKNHLRKLAEADKP